MAGIDIRLGMIYVIIETHCYHNEKRGRKFKKTSAVSIG